MIQKPRAAAVPKSRKQRNNSNSRKASTKATKSVTMDKSSGDGVDAAAIGASPRLTKSLGPKVSWESPTHKLEMHAPRDPIRQKDMEGPENCGLQKNVKNYVEKIDTLMDELGTLKNEVELQKSLRDLEKKEDELDKSRDSLKEQDEELKCIHEDLKNTDHDNEKLRRVLDQVQNEAHETRVDRDRLCAERERLKKKLLEVEMDGRAATRQIYELKDVIRQLQYENTSNSAISQKLTDTRGDLLEKLSEFEKTNKSLRQMLQEQHAQEVDLDRQREQVEMLLLKISEYESRCQRLSLEVLEKDRSINELQAHVQGQLSENIQASNVVKSLENIKAHLQQQLKTREGDIGRLNVQIRTLEANIEENKGLAAQLKQMSDQLTIEIDEKDGLKKACRIYKQKAEKCEEMITVNTAQLTEKERKLSDLDAQLTDVRGRLSTAESNNVQLQTDNDGLHKQVTDLENTYKNAQMLAQRQQQDLLAQIDAKTEALNLSRAENESLKTEIQGLRSSIEKYETLVEEYKTEMQRTRKEAEMTVAQLEHEQLHNSQVQKDSQQELQQLKDRLQLRLQELEPLPALLEKAELDLQANQTRLLAYDQRNSEKTNLIAELSAKLELEHEQSQSSHDRTRSAQEHNRALMLQNESLERNAIDTENRNRDLTLLLGQRDQAIASANSRLEESTRENMALTRQLENAMADLRRQTDTFRDKSMAKERTNHTRINELEHEVTQLKTESIRLKREKEEADHHCMARICDLNDRLEQSYATNRSLQTYVHFLKQSYGNVFGDICAEKPCPSLHKH